MLIIHSPQCLEYAAASHPESPERVIAAVAALRHRHHEWIVPGPCAEEDILRVHTSRLLEAVKHGPFFDEDTPFFPEMYEQARLAAGGAILAAQKSLAGQAAFSLMRPPGHHAERDRVMGFCYFNNLAMAAAKLLQDASAGVRRVAVLDFDCHHGNGTEDIFRGDDRVLFASLHQSPCYPGTGLAAGGNCLNYPLEPGTGPKKFLAALADALDRLGAFEPDVLAVSAGFDAYKGDPLTQMDLEIDTFHEIGMHLASFCQAKKKAAAALPCFMVLEGGYSGDFGRCVEAFVNAWW